MSTFSHTAAQPLVPAIAPLTQALSPLAEPMVRVAAGLLLVPHGAQKLFGWFGGYGLEATGQFFATKLGLPAGLALVAGLIEFAGGLMLAAGLATRAVAALATGLLLVAAFGIHLGNGFFWTAGGFEYPLLWGVVTLAFAIRGGGRFSADSLIGREI
ncbi:DoxX family protein [Magnetospirillum sp. ME-1]|uniref:DoxX family protein n=1 Tax=Magnetospirillum sp. ME-1 TaxID=1639348 RepID=UPI000A179C31|nr:DoxX family protein [Magnetospirillum sp. ME-1]ARJ67222.1 DoxX family protein [Magnetospirillum sp. ME-1]